jgi:hypothetical protein
MHVTHHFKKEAKLGTFNIIQNRNFTLLMIKPKFVGVISVYCIFILSKHTDTARDYLKTAKFLTC